MEFTNDQIEFMRADLENGMNYTKLIERVRKLIEARGGNFEEEFETWKKKQAIQKCHLGYGDMEVIR